MSGASVNIIGGGTPKADGLTKPSAAGFGYKSQFNDQRQGMNTGHVLGRHEQESKFVPQFGSATGKQAAADLSKSQQFNDQAQLARGADNFNAQQGLRDSLTKAELTQAGRSNAAKIYSDMTGRATDQIGLAAQLQQAMIRNRTALMTALTSD
jgi:hypothetical protein